MNDFMTDMIADRPPDNTDLESQIERLKAVNKIALMLGTTLDFEAFIDQLITAVLDYVGCERVIVLVPDDQDMILEYGSSNYRVPDTSKQNALENLKIPMYSVEESPLSPLVTSWLAGNSNLVKADDSPLVEANTRLVETIGAQEFYATPLMLDGQLIGLIFIDNIISGTPLLESHSEALHAVSQSTAMALQNARLHRKTVLELADNMREMYILRQIDRELNDTIDLSHVFQMTLDWALRFTNAQYASLSLYNEEADSLWSMTDYGYDLSADKLANLRREYGTSITQRVARSGRAEVVPDITTDPDFVRLAANVRSQLSVPVMREDRVIAVITLESKKLNGFTDNHLDFVAKLATRAGVAIDNARLYEESIREREKLSHILSNTADVVIVIGSDDRVMLINQSALGAMHLYPGENYVGRPIFDTFENQAFLDAYRRAKASGENVTQEIAMPNERVFYANLRLHEGIGCIIVMHDITPFKEMDKLKSELIATVSHDLKQPLGVMNGYVELLMMQQAVSPQGLNHIQMIRRAVQNMRQLIDDLLDLTKIESGIKLDLQPVPINAVVTDCIESLRPTAQNKQMMILSEINDTLPQVIGDKSRLRQILMNLIGNAVKYTPPEGWVKVTAEPRGGTLRLAIQDNGLGISPEDQIHIFDRFYRVRRPETDSIEGTGLGLAIVKSLVEAHNGQINLESRLGEGSTFYLTLPVAS
jgi:signal transduction histidine kinase